MRIGSLCSGYGGLELGVQAVYGGETAWVSDIDRGACKILAHRFPDVPNIGDMTTVDWAAVEPVDLICGGTPCQDLSHAGKRAGMSEGTRSNLWVAMREAIAVIRPSTVIWENVGGAYSAAADSEMERDPRLLGVRPDGPVLRALGRVLGDLASLGYDASWHGIRASDVGAPHGRFRVFVVATDAAGSGRAALNVQRDQPRGLGSTDATDPRRGTALLPSPRTSDTNGAGSHGDGGLDLRTVVSLLPTPKARDFKNAGHPDQAARRAAERAQDLPEVIVNHGSRWGDYTSAIARWETVLGRTAPAPTMTSTKGNPQLSPAFVEWMMGLPAGWVTDVPGITRNEALKALGNGVVPQQAAEALRVMASWEVAA